MQMLESLAGMMMIITEGDSRHLGGL